MWCYSKLSGRHFLCFRWVPCILATTTHNVSRHWTRMIPLGINSNKINSVRHTSHPRFSRGRIQFFRLYNPYPRSTQKYRRCLPYQFSHPDVSCLMLMSHDYQVKTIIMFITWIQYNNAFLVILITRTIFQYNKICPSNFSNINPINITL